MRILRFTLLCLVAACGGSERPAPGRGSSAGSVARGQDAAAPAARDTVPKAPAPAARVSSLAGIDTAIVRGLYVNRFAVQSRKRMAQMIAIADSTEINALVLDAKDEFGLNYRSANPAFARNAGSGHGMVADFRPILDTLRAHGIRSIARVVVFKDPVAAGLNPDWQIRTPAGGSWRDEKGNAWVNPYNRDVWAYNLGVSEELVRLGFDEIQFDYIRFPEPYKRLAPQVFASANGVSKADNLASYLKEAKARLNKLGVPVTADIFGLVTTVRGPLEVGQWWEKISPNVDVVLPMVYPSHYPKGSLGVANPNAQPYDIILKALEAARQRDAKLGITAPEHVRPWLQAFSLYGVTYDASHITLQKKAVYEAGYDGWVMWHPGSKYETFLPALEKTLESRRKKP